MAKVTSAKVDHLRRFETRCRELGIPVTIQRRVIFEALLERKDHPTADRIFEQVQKKMPGVSRATVYRVLETLVRSGLARHVYSADSSIRFDPMVERHHHFVCGGMTDFMDSALDGIPLSGPQKAGFHAEDYSIYFNGCCSQCAGKSADTMQRPKRKTNKSKKGNKTLT